MAIEKKENVTDSEGEKQKALAQGKSVVIIHGKGFQVKTSSADVVVIETRG